MSGASRRKGLGGEHEVAAIYQRHGFAVRGLEGSGDHLALLPVLDHPDAPARYALTIHSEVKRCETARPWAWWAQASEEAPAGTLAVVAFRRSRSPWLALTDLDALAGVLARR